MNKIEILNNISQTVDQLYDLVVEDEFLSSDFEKFLKVNEIEIESQAQFNSVVTNYLFEGKTQDGRLVLDYCGLKIGSGEIIDAIKKSNCGIFEIKRISKTGYEVYSLTSEIELTLVSLIKTSNLRSIGRYDFIKARIIEFESEFYLLEIFDCIGSNYKLSAYREAIKMIIQKPSILCYKNPQKIELLKKDIQKKHSDFVEFFQESEIITTNRKADSLINAFSAYWDGEKLSYAEFIEEIACNKYFSLKEFDDDDFLRSASLGFSAQDELYDVGLYSDEKFGFFAIPFLGTFRNILKGEKVESSDQCILEFLFDDKIPPSVFEKQENALKIINNVLKRAKIKEFKEIEEMMRYFKPKYYEEFNCSSILAIYNSEVFAKYSGFEETVV